MRDPIRDAFLEHQRCEAERLNAASDRVKIIPLEGTPPDRYVIDLHCRGLVRDAADAIRVAERFVCGVSFSEDYLRSIPNPFQVLTVLHPAGAFHPNIAANAPFVCPGRLPPGMGIVELTYQLWSLWTYRTYNLVDGLNAEACRYARAHQTEFPIDQRSLKRIPVSFTVAPAPACPLPEAGHNPGRQPA